MKTAGFTLVELIVIMVIIGVLAVFAAPRFFDRKDFESRGFKDETISLLRYAQKAAVAKRRTVCVASSATGVTLTISSAAPPSVVCDSPLAMPAPPRGGTGLTVTPASFKFLASGATDQAANITATVTGSTGLTVDAVTGYVY